LSTTTYLPNRNLGLRLPGITLDKDAIEEYELVTLCGRMAGRLAFERANLLGIGDGDVRACQTETSAFGLQILYYAIEEYGT